MLTAFVDDPDALIAGKYACQDQDREQLRQLIRQDWQQLNNYIPTRLRISFRKRANDPTYDGAVITALEG